MMLANFKQTTYSVLDVKTRTCRDQHRCKRGVAILYGPMKQGVPKLQTAPRDQKFRIALFRLQT